jgi:FKBP-type peptidyl-prolyl cis-trans isomerase SlyD
MMLGKEIFAEAPAEIMVVGNTLHMQDQNGNPVPGTIVEITDEGVRMDFNHPLAGVELHFEVMVLEVRDATQEELAHGHVHGVGGHQH